MLSKPFSDKIIFVDTEFSTFDPYQGEILSIGMIKMTGEELYLELEYNEQNISGFVREKILPYLSPNKVSREDAKKMILEFIGPDKPFMVACAPSFDVVYLHKLLGVDNFPFDYHVLDWPSMLFILGIDPLRDDHGKNPEFYKKLGIDIDKKKYRKHHALDDAKFLKEAYLKFFG